MVNKTTEQGLYEAKYGSSIYCHIINWNHEKAAFYESIASI